MRNLFACLSVALVAFTPPCAAQQAPAVASAPSTQTPPNQLAQQTPAPPPAEQRLAETYARSLEGTTNALEKVIEAQANQINVFSWAVGIIGLLFALAGFSIVRFFRKTVKEAVDERVLALVSSRIDVDGMKAAKLNAVLFQTLAVAARDVALSRKRELVAKVESGILDVSAPADIDKLISLLADAALLPLHVMSNVYSILSADEEPGKVRERVYVLFAEVAADKIGPRAMLGMVSALINILHGHPSRTSAMPYLTGFSKQLSNSIETGVRVEQPEF